MRMNKGSAQGSSHLNPHHQQHHHHHHHHHHHQQQPQNFQHYPQATGVQQSKDLKKIIKILKKHVIKQKITRKMKIVV
ncbi:GH10803 [Drosophila grimshawi]|uniref:GH10803 n=2 Tax=Drosophila grimshawi TaxID=7222 RepID=B4JB02_DROGR|nr:GH10803 [Drosophila grimshawi]